MSQRPGTRIIDTSDGFTDSVLYPSGNLIFEWNAKKAKQSVKLEHKSSISAIAYNREANLAASADDAGQILIWELLSFEILLEIELNEVANVLEFSNDGRFLAAIETMQLNNQQRILVWDLLSDMDSSPAFTAELPLREFHTCLRFSGVFSNRLISNGSSSVLFWTYSELDQGSLKCIVPDSESVKADTKFTVSSFMPNGMDALTGTVNGNLILWKKEVATDKEQYQSPEDNESYVAVKTLNSTSSKVSLLTTKSESIIVGTKGGHLNFLDSNLKLNAWLDGFGDGYIHSISFSGFSSNLSIADSEFAVENNGEIYRSSSCTKESTKLLWKPRWLQHLFTLTVHPRKAHIAGIEPPNHIVVFNIDTLEEICIGLATGEVLILDEADLKVTTELKNCKCKIHRVVANASGCYLAALNDRRELLVYELLETQNGTSKWEYSGKRSSRSDDCCTTRSFDFYDTPDGESRLFELKESGDLFEMNIKNSVSATGLITQKALPKARKGLSFCLSPPLRYFDHSNRDIDAVIAGLDGKLYVENLNTGSHVCTYFSPAGEAPFIQFGFFQKLDVSSSPLMWYATVKGHVGITSWPPSSNLKDHEKLVVLDGDIQSVQVCHDAERLVFHTSTNISIWKIGNLSIDENLTQKFKADEFFDENTIVSISECFNFFNSMNGTSESQEKTKMTITVEQMDMIMCRMGFYPTVEEIQDMISELQIQSLRELDEEWSGEISEDQFLSLFARYHRVEDTDKLIRSFSQVMDGYEEISKEDFLWKLDSTLVPIQKEVQNSIKKVIGEQYKSGNEILPFADYISLESFLNWLKTDS
eukprot:g3355.t1